MKYPAGAATLLLSLLLPALLPGAASAQPVVPAGDTGSATGISNSISSGRGGGAACMLGKPAAGCRPAAAKPSKRAPASQTPPNRTQADQTQAGPAQAGSAQANQALADHERDRAQQQAALGDMFGGRTIPPKILKIMANPRIEPVVAYMVWQAARKPIDEWTLRQLQEITAIIPTLPETGMPMSDIQALYKYLGLDPSDVFNPQLGNNWQDNSTRFDRSSAAAVAAVSSADCQTDPGEMTVATFRSCRSGGQ